MRKLFISAAGALAALAAVATAAAMPAAPPGAVPVTAGRAGPMIAGSPTWGGYMALAPAGRKINDVSAFWTVPAPDTSRVWGKPSYRAAEWVGMDGFGTGSLPVYGPIQAGVWSGVTAKGGQPKFFLFWEMAGPGDPGPHYFTTDNSPPRPDESNYVQVHPGDEIGADVQWGYPNGNAPDQQFLFSVTVYPGGDTLRPEYHDANAPIPQGWPADQLRKRAEVITEIPSSDGGGSPAGAMDMGVVRYSGASYLLQYEAGAKLNGWQPVAQTRVIQNSRYSPISELVIWPSGSYQDPGYTYKDGFYTRLHHYGL
jgi:Peptidase A4 family